MSSNKMEEHTPGPWLYDKKRHAIISTVSWFLEPGEEGDEGIRTSVVSLYAALGGENPEADVQLIAAAPELLAACRDARVALKGKSHNTDIALYAIDEAIAKAEGK